MYANSLGVECRGSNPHRTGAAQGYTGASVGNILARLEAQDTSHKAGNSGANPDQYAYLFGHKDVT